MQGNVKNFAWEVPDTYVDDEYIPRDAINIYTLVLKQVDVFGGIHILVFQKWSVPRLKGEYIFKLNEFSTIESLRMRYPNLFELEGVAVLSQF